MTDRDIFTILNYLNNPERVYTLEEVTKSLQDKLIIAPNLIHHHIINTMREWVTQIEPQPPSFQITSSGKNQLEHLKAVFAEQENEKELKRLSKEASTTSIEVGKATKGNILTQKILGFSTLSVAVLVAIIQICNYQLTRQTQQQQKVLQPQLEMLQLKQSNIENILDSLSNQVRTLEKKNISALIVQPDTITSR